MIRTKPTAGMLQTHKLNVLSEMMNRATLASKLGEQYGGDRNVYEALGYKTELAWTDYWARYARQDIAKAIINRPVSYTWKGPLVLSEADDKNDTALEKDWITLEKELDLKSKFVRVDKLASIGRYGIMLLGFSDTQKPEDYKNEVTGTKLELRFVKPLSEGKATINTYVKNSSDPRFGLVETYKVQYQEPGSEKPVDLIVHHTRVIHVTTELLESEIFGTPVMQAVYNRLMDLEKLVGGSAEMFWRGARPGYQGIVKDDYTVPTGVQDSLQEQLNEFENNLRRTFVNEGIKLESLAPQVADPSAHVDIQIQMISAITGIPKRILTGSERGELASEQDLTGWYSVVQTRREEYATANIVRPFVERMIEYGILPKPSTDDYMVEWTDLFAASEKDKAAVGKTRAEALRAYASDPLAQFIVPPESFLELFLGLDADKVAQLQSQVSDMLDEERQAIIEESRQQSTGGQTTEEDDE